MVLFIFAVPMFVAYPHNLNPTLNQTEHIYFFTTFGIAFVLVISGLMIKNVLFALGVQLFTLGMVYYYRVFLFRKSSEVRIFKQGLTTHDLLKYYAIVISAFIIFNVINCLVINERSQALQSGILAIEGYDSGQPVKNRKGIIVNPNDYFNDYTGTTDAAKNIKNHQLGMFNKMSPAEKVIMRMGRETRTGKIKPRGFK